MLRTLVNASSNWLSKSDSEIARYILTRGLDYGVEVTHTFEQIRKSVPVMLRTLGIDKTSPSPVKPVLKPEAVVDDYQVDINKRIQSSKEKALQTKYDRLLVDYQNVSGALDDALSIKGHTTSTSFFESMEASDKNEATVILQWSDWHIEEIVNPATVMGLNSFSPEIAKRRVQKLLENTVKVIRSQRGAVNIRQGLIHLGGDFITGYLREHDMQDNAMTPVEAIIYAKELLIGALQYMLDNAELDQILCICNRGNHPRLTPKMQPSNDYKMNLEALLYHMLDQHFAGDERIEFKIPESPIGMVTIYGKKIRFFHGHEIQYKDGVGGLSIPLNKKLQKWDSTMQADFNLMGHYHQCYKPLKTCMLNGSLVGYNAYALSGGFSYEPAMQSFQLLDAQRGFTLHTTIDCN